MFIEEISSALCNRGNKRIEGEGDRVYGRNIRQRREREEGVIFLLI